MEKEKSGLRINARKVAYIIMACAFDRDTFSPENLEGSIKDFIEIKLNGINQSAYKYFSRVQNRPTSKTLARALGLVSPFYVSISQNIFLENLFDLYIAYFRQQDGISEIFDTNEVMGIVSKYLVREDLEIFKRNSGLEETAINTDRDDLESKKIQLNSTFSDQIVNILSERVCSWCSCPWCSIFTGGADLSDSGKSVNIGVACFINSPIPGTERYDTSLTIEQLVSVDNGIWLCHTHADFINAPKSSGITAHTLKEWKTEREDIIRALRAGRLTIILSLKDKQMSEVIKEAFKADKILQSSSFDGTNNIVLCAMNIDTIKRAFIFYRDHTTLLVDAKIIVGIKGISLNTFIRD